MTPLIAEFYSPSLELVIFVIAIAIDIFLAIAVYRSNPKSATNRIFSLLSIFTMLWVVDTYVAGLPAFQEWLPIHRLGIFFAAPQAFLFFLLGYNMPSDEMKINRRYLYALIGLTATIMLINISPYAFVGVTVIDGVMRLQAGIGMLPFSVASTIFSVLAVYFLVKKYLISTGVARKQFQLVLIGICIMLISIIATIMIPIAFFNASPAIWLAPLYTLAFLGMTAYAITKYQLFEIKVLLAQTLTLTICLVLFARIFGETSTDARIVDFLLLSFVVVFGYFLVKSVQREVAQREEIEKLSAEKSEFMTFASHEIRNPLTAMRGYASLITDGTLGDVPPPVKDTAQKILVLGNEVLLLISEYLNKSKLELGMMSYTITEFELGEAVCTVVEGYRPHTDQKGLKLICDVDANEHLKIKADVARVKEVVGNIIDNSLKYTPHGSITVSTHRHGVHARVTIADTGVGIPPETIPHLFRKFSRADAQKVNILGTGIGLYLAKNITEAMGGRIWAESDGRDKGSRFILEFPIV